MTGTAKIAEYVSVETYLPNQYVSYTGRSGAQYSSRPMSSITVLKNSALVVQGNLYNVEISGGIRELNFSGEQTNAVVTYKITGDGSITT